MKIAQINSVVYGSTGRIMLMIAETARQKGYDVLVASPKCRTNMNIKGKQPYLFGHIILRNISAQLAYYTGYSGCYNFIDTKALLKVLEKYKPDVIHLHNLHSEYVNLRLLFNYIKKRDIPVVWTLHDCWAFTGGCSHFVLQDCYRWETGCYECNIHRQYPGSLFDNSQKMWNLKKSWFSGVSQLTIVTPSNWLRKLVSRSYLKDYPIRVVHNGINLDVFYPCKSDFRIRYCIETKKIVLGVAFGWGYRKGLDIMIRLSELLPDSYKIVLVGTNENVDKQLPESILSIHRTENQHELCELYSAADVFVNPTREDTFPTVNLEALACGTPVVTFDTGGSPECIDETCGIVVPHNDEDGIHKAITLICENRPYSTDSCIARAHIFNQDNAYNQYIHIYEEAVKR